MPESVAKATKECLESLIALKAPTRLAAHDVSLYHAIDGAASYAANYLGWTALSSQPPLSVETIAATAEAIRREGLEAVVLIGQGGSSQASMTITKLHEVASGCRDQITGEEAPGLGQQPCEVAFRTMDSLSPVFVNHILGASDPARTLYLVSSKSGSTIELQMLERVTWRYVTGHLGVAGAAQRFVAITDSGSPLEEMAREKSYRLILNSPSDVGGRFSALSVFALFPAALVGIDIQAALLHTTAVEYACTQDNEDNPALQLAAFIHANYQAGRDKISLVMPPSGQVFGLWIEQLVAESLGKGGIGVLPNVEVDASILAHKRRDRCIIAYEVGNPEGFAESISNFHPSIPALRFTLNTVTELFGRFVVWEYAIAFLGILLGVNPFDQPNVEETKKRVRLLLSEQPEHLLQTSDYLQIDYPLRDYVRTLRFSDALLKAAEISDADTESLTVDQALRALLGSIGSGDYFSLNAFLPFRGYGRREALERMRNRVVSRLGAVSCLEIGPRYLHSTGQLHKGGPNNGVFLYLSADEDNDIAIPGESYTLGTLATTQARGDFEALACRGRRALQVHLAGNDSETLARFADRLCLAISAIM